jgi:uncharacterized protein YndB with AHSA1/START domain
MISYRIEQTIDRPVQEVFSYVADPIRYPEWMDVSDVHVETLGAMGVGSTGRAMMKMGSRHIPYDWEVTGYEAGVSFGFRTTSGPFDWEGRFETSSANDTGTRVVTTGTIGLKGWRRVLEPLMRGEIQRGEAAELRRLKDLLERRA